VLLDSLIEQNVLLQMNHLRTHPSIAGQLALGKVGIAGWVYDIARGAVSVYNEASLKFEPVSVASSRPA
jgi:carbonic anhydrase